MNKSHSIKDDVRKKTIDLETPPNTVRVLGFNKDTGFIFSTSIPVKYYGNTLDQYIRPTRDRYKMRNED